VGREGLPEAVSFADLYSDVSARCRRCRPLGCGRGRPRRGLHPEHTRKGRHAALAALSQGIVCRPGSPDFGVDGRRRALRQIEPKVLFCGRRLPLTTARSTNARAGREIVERLLPGPAEKGVVVQLDAQRRRVRRAEGGAAGRMAAALHRGDIAFAQLPFDHPCTSFSPPAPRKPKCIVHGAGGALLQNLKMHKLQSTSGQATASSISAPPTGCVEPAVRRALRGSERDAVRRLPFARDGRILFDCRGPGAFHALRHFGEVPRRHGEARPAPRDTHELAALRMILSTGSPLAPESFDYVYDAVMDAVCLSSISGHRHHGRLATPIPSCPVYRGELQCRSLGIAVRSF